MALPVRYGIPTYTLTYFSQPPLFLLFFFFCLFSFPDLGSNSLFQIGIIFFSLQAFPRSRYHTPPTAVHIFEKNTSESLVVLRLR